MILTGTEIQARLGYDIEISDFDPKRLNPNSYNLRLAPELLVYENKTLDMRLPNPTTPVEIDEGGYYLHPGQLYLARRIERTATRNLVPRIDGRSSIGRLGLFVHVTAGFGDVGFVGHWTLELHCVQPIRIYPGVEIAQISYHTVCGQVTEYKGKYQGNAGVQASALHKDFEG